MDTEARCPSCGKALPANAPKGLCPECLMKAGFGTGVAPEQGQPGRSPAFVPPTVADLAQLFPQLEILELIGHGGMGAVYKARQPALDRLVALKILPPQPGAELAFADRFTREARALARLSHPNIVAVHEFGQAGGLNYFVMEYVEGLNLRQLQQARRLSPREALKIIPQICDALQFAHDEGIVHRDIKPENVMVDKKGRAKITDFGLAKILGRETESMRLTGVRDVMGTPHYMAPEQVEHPQEVDHRADIYSLGVVFYEMLTGELPLGRFQPPSRKVEVDVRLDDVVLHALEKEPERRYQQASQVKTDVENITANPASEGAPPPISPQDSAHASRITHQLALPGFTAESVRVQFVWLRVTWWLGWLLSAVGELSNPFAVLSLPFLIMSTVFWCILLYRHWSLLQGHGARTTPGKAVGYGFIPFFFFYWWFVAYVGLATDNNRYLRELGISHRRMSRGLAIAVCVLSVLICTVGLMPVAGAILAIPYMIVGYLAARQQRECIYAILEARSGTRVTNADAEPAWTGAPPKLSEPVTGRGTGVSVGWKVALLLMAGMIGLVALLIGGLMLTRLVRRPAVVHTESTHARHPASAVSLADQPHKLRSLATPEVISIGLSKPGVPWAWQELERRAREGRLDHAMAGAVLADLTSWLERDYSAGYREPLHWLPNLLNELAGRRLVTDDQIVQFLLAFEGQPQLQPIERLRESQRSLLLNCTTRNIWNYDLMGMTVLAEVKSISIDHEPVALPKQPKPSWRNPHFNTVLQPIELTPGKHTLECEVETAIVPKGDVTGLPHDAPPEAWPPAKHRWTRVVETTFEVVADKAESALQ